MKKDKGITVKKREDMPQWFEQVVLKSELAEHAPIKGCMIIRPRGYAIWQAIQDYFNPVMQKYGVKNAYFPLFIPEKFFSKEAEHAKGFAPEVAWVESKTGDTQKYAIRPTSETIIYDAYARWIRSWRDLPLRLNQWCNICRWEVQDCKLFLRSREFLWQEGHCVYETEEECVKEQKEIIFEYKTLAENLLAIPVIAGQKTSKEKFAGAKTTYTIETLMPDGKALQLGTSHNLGQGFAKAFDIYYKGKDEKEHHPWQNSWGISTRLIGAMVMMHSDDQGLVLPPSIAEKQVVIVPIIFDTHRAEVQNLCDQLVGVLEKKQIRVFCDTRQEYSSGWKFHEWEMKGIPLRVEVGPEDVMKQQCIVVFRHTGKKQALSIKTASAQIPQFLAKIQKELFINAKKALQQKTIDVHDLGELKSVIAMGNWARAYFHEDEDLEEEIKEKIKGVTTRCIPFGTKVPEGKKCFYSGKNATCQIIFGRTY